MATTLNDLVTEAQSLLRSFTALSEPSTHLTSGINTSALSLAVADGDVVGVGVVEIDDELLFVESSSGGLLTIPPYGRGFMGTAPATHSTGARVVVGPIFPRKNVVDALAETARAVYPKLFAVKTKEFTFASGRQAYDLAADAERVLHITASTTSATLAWPEIRAYDFDPNAQVAAFPSGRSLTLGQLPVSGSTVRVIYAAPFTEMSLPTDTLAAAGFAESHRDVLVYGACARLILFLDPGRLNYSAVENDARAAYVQAGMASQVAGRIAALYEKRLEDERKRLLGQYPTSTRWSRF